MKMLVGAPVALLLAACAAPAPPKQMAWQRTDGKPFSNEQLQADMAFCDGEVAKAGLTDTARAGRNWGVGASLYQDQALQRVQVGCMGGRGYILVQAN